MHACMSVHMCVCIGQRTSQVFSTFFFFFFFTEYLPDLELAR